MRNVPERPSLDGLEAKWSERWEADGIYSFDRSRDRSEVYSIDTPPPTSSGSLHVGHLFSYTHTDTIARYQRMKGREVFYPMGWDDNGLPTERRVQNYYGVRCDPTLHYHPNFTPPEVPPEPAMSVSRPNFIELCLRLTVEDEQAFENLFRTLGLSVDWSQTYRTIDDHCRRVSQRAFLRNLKRGEAYTQEAPVLWDIDFQTAVAQAELQDREQAGAFYRIAFYREDGSRVPIETTRPELVCSCVALVAHPEDARYGGLIGTSVRTPVFDVEVPVVSHDLADPEKGTGIAMICTFGDVTDVIWWRELHLPTRAVVLRNGRFRSEPPEWIESSEGLVAYQQLAGLSVKKAHKRMVEMLVAGGHLIGQPRPISHQVKFYEKGERPLEIVTSRQWYLRNGGRDHRLREELLQRGKELQWIPDYMRTRFDHWVNGLAGDWLISRQRFFGVPIPVWYPIDREGKVEYDRPLMPDEADLPVDPSDQPPPGYAESDRGHPGGFIGDPDVMDTWATSSLTPQIAGWWEDDPDLFSRVFPMDLRPQAHEIIRTWLFATVARAHLEHDSLPWWNAAISGWVLDPERKKMSKSQGNVVVPLPLLGAHGADAVRYWAASGRPGADTAVDEGKMRIGRRLAIKILNASRFVLGLAGDTEAPVTEPVDRSMLAGLASLIERCTVAFDQYDYSKSLDETERAFWAWCDDYLELVKGRAYGSGPNAGSARRALQLGLSIFLRLFAPILPFVTEEVWSWWRQGSVHRSPWPTADELAEAGDHEVLPAVAEVLAVVRKTKSDAKASMKTPVTRLVVRDGSERLALIRAGLPDLIDAASAIEPVLEEGPPGVVVLLG
jgi:valyl-tRNA synthetase